MTVVMVYHDLVERDSKYVDRCWKTIIAWLLAAVVCSTLFVGFSFHTLFIQYSSNCIIKAKLAFNESVRFSYGIFPFLNRFHLSDYGVGIHQYKDLKSIDVQSSRWGNTVACDYMSFIPLFEAMCATIWFFLFLLCGHGGRGSGTILFKPWRIVMPAIIFFAIMSILSFTYFGMLFHYLNQFCIELHGGFMTKTPSYQAIDCGALIHIHALNTTTDVSVYSNYVMLNIFTIISAFLWLLVLLIMICRVIFLVDFQLMRVTISTIGDSLEEIGKNEKTEKIIKKVQIYSSAIHIPVSESTKREDVQPEIGETHPRTNDGIEKVDENSENKKFIRKSQLDDASNSGRIGGADPAKKYEYPRRRLIGISEEDILL